YVGRFAAVLSPATPRAAEFLYIIGAYDSTTAGTVTPVRMLPRLALKKRRRMPTIHSTTLLGEDARCRYG
ncbi:MAG: hypothetical protein OEM78_09055, partial [Gammaproteobacteria bacterium]|nr:hypothetical protein [Gammaproteobacteria bacterium]